MPEDRTGRDRARPQDAGVDPAQARDGLFFIEPDGSNREEARRLGYRFVDMVVDAASGAANRPPLSRETSAGTAPYIPPAAGRDLESLLAEAADILRHGMNPAHPGYVGHMDTLASSVGIFSDLIVSAMNNNMLAWEMSPLFTEMEQRVMAWIASLFGLDNPEVRSEAGPMGTMVSGGTLANMTALLVARNACCSRMGQGGVRSDGPDGRRRASGDITSAATEGKPDLVFLASENAHFSFSKAANLLGLGRDGWIRVESDSQGRVVPEAMDAALCRSREEGREPFCLVGVAGTTVTGSIDPLYKLADLAHREGLWFHVDAAYGGALALSDTLRSRLPGIGRADSITFNPQKWLFVPKTCATILFRDSAQVDAHLREPFIYGSVNHSTAAGSKTNLGELTIQGTRRVDILKLYLTLEHLGTERLAGFVQNQVDLARDLAGLIRSHDELELINEPDMNIICFRYRGATGRPRRQDDESHLDRVNAKIHGEIERGGSAWLSMPRYRNRNVLRMVILHPRCTAALLRGVIDTALRIGRECTAPQA